MSSDRPVFIVGCPRSGTTMLALMLHAHPRIAIPPETRFLISTWRDRHRFGDLSTREQQGALASAIAFRGSKIKDLGLRRADMRREILKAPATVGSAMGVVFQEYARLHGKPRWGDKRPVYYQEVGVLLRLFPDAQIVHIVRDGRANVASLKGMPWWTEGTLGAIASWAFSERCLRRNTRRLPADTFYSVQYEKLVCDPRQELTDLCAFLGEEFHEAMLEPRRVSDVVPGRKHWHAKLRRGVTTQAVDSWRTELEPWEVGLIEALHGRALARHGYERSGAGSWPSPLVLARYAQVAAKFQISARRRWAFEAVDAQRSTLPVAAQLTSRQRELVGLQDRARSPLPDAP